MRNNPTYIGELELSEDTLAHYGVKGMKWRRRKVRGNKRRLNIQKARTTPRTLDSGDYLNLADRARTDEERRALRNAGYNRLADETGRDENYVNLSGGRQYVTVRRRKK